MPMCMQWRDHRADAAAGHPVDVQPGVRQLAQDADVGERSGATAGEHEARASDRPVGRRAHAGRRPRSRVDARSAARRRWPPPTPRAAPVPGSGPTSTRSGWRDGAGSSAPAGSCDVAAGDEDDHVGLSQAEVAPGPRRAGLRRRRRPGAPGRDRPRPRSRPSGSTTPGTTTDRCWREPSPAARRRPRRARCPGAGRRRRPPPAGWPAGASVSPGRRCAGAPPPGSSTDPRRRRVGRQHRRRTRRAAPPARSSRAGHALPPSAAHRSAAPARPARRQARARARSRPPTSTSSRPRRTTYADPAGRPAGSATSRHGTVRRRAASSSRARASGGRSRSIATSERSVGPATAPARSTPLGLPGRRRVHQRRAPVLDVLALRGRVQPPQGQRDHGHARGTR